MRRQGRMTASQKQALEKLWAQYGLEQSSQQLDYQKIFQRQAPVILEIGFGMGQSLLALAEQHSGNNYLGIEVHRPGVGSLFKAMAEHHLTNLKVFCADAVEVLEQQIPNASLDAILIFFPDPWHKQRHQKRRLIQTAFVELLISKLKLGGRLHLATDWKDYALHMMQVLSAQPKLINSAGAGNYIQVTDERPKTKFEKRGERLGHGVWDMIFTRGDEYIKEEQQ